MPAMRPAPSLNSRRYLFRRNARIAPITLKFAAARSTIAASIESGHTALALRARHAVGLFTPPAGLHEFFIPRIHLGGVYDLGGGTSYGYAGLLFTYNITSAAVRRAVRRRRGEQRRRRRSTSATTRSAAPR